MIGSRRRHAAKEVTVDSLDARTKARERTARTTCTAQPDGAPPDVPRRPAAAALAALALGARSRAKATGLGTRETPTETRWLQQRLEASSLQRPSWGLLGQAFPAWLFGEWEVCSRPVAFGEPLGPRFVDENTQAAVREDLAQRVELRWKARYYWEYLDGSMGSKEEELIRTVSLKLEASASATCDEEGDVFVSSELFRQVISTEGEIDSVGRFEVLNDPRRQTASSGVAYRRLSPTHITVKNRVAKYLVPEDELYEESQNQGRPNSPGGELAGLCLGFATSQDLHWDALRGAVCRLRCVTCEKKKTRSAWNKAEEDARPTEHKESKEKEAVRPLRSEGPGSGRRWKRFSRKEFLVVWGAGCFMFDDLYEQEDDGAEMPKAADFDGAGLYEEEFDLDDDEVFDFGDEIGHAGPAAVSVEETVETMMSVTSFIFCSVSMIVFNKLVITAFPFESTLTALQMAFTVLVLLAAFPFLHIGSFRDALRWSLVAPCFAGGLLTAMLALKHCTLTLVIVVRALTPIFTLLAESFNNGCKVNRQELLSILIAVLGALLYTKELGFEHLVGVGWIFVNTCFSVLLRLLQRRMLAADQDPVDISKGGCSLINNAMGLLPLLATAYITGDGSMIQGRQRRPAPNQLALLSSQELIFMGISCVVAAAISYANIWCQSLISATSMLILVNLTRFLVILLDATLLHTDRLSTLQLLGALITVLGGMALAMPDSQPKEEPAAASYAPAKTSQEP
eukprot:g20254.t1